MDPDLASTLNPDFFLIKTAECKADPNALNLDPDPEFWSNLQFGSGSRVRYRKRG